MRKNRSHPALFLLVAVIGLVLFIVLIKNIFSPDNQVQNVVEEFYTHEQDGDFASSWKLFHPYMKQRFPKSIYIQDRSHVFIGHFGAETFTFTVSEPEKIENWRPEKGHKLFTVTYSLSVVQTYKGKYGKFSFQQDVYVVKHKDEWVIVWDYNL